MAQTLAVIAAWALFAYGFFTNGLLAVDPWSSLGLRRFLIFTAAYGVCALLAIRYRRRQALFLAGMAVMIHVIVRSGPLPFLAVALVLLAAYATGRLIRFAGLTALLIGLAILVTLTGFLVLLPINSPVLYWALLGGLALLAWRFREPFEAPSEWGLAPAFPLLAHLAVALKPEMSADGLAMHLAIPSAVAYAGRFPFDHRHTAWALMPMNGDWAYTAAHFIGGEAGARLLNWTFLVLLCLLLYRALRRITSEPRAALLTALFASAPFIQLVTGSMFVENFWTLLAFAAILALLEFRESGSSSPALAAAILLGTGVAAKFGAIAMILPCGVLAAMAARRNRRAAMLFVLLLAAFAAPPYARAYVKSGNPVFPFYNHVFKSPDFESAKPFFDSRFTKGVHAGDLYGMTFKTPTYLEARPGGWAFQYIFLVPLSLVFLRRSQPAAARWALLAGLSFAVLSLAGQSNARYVYPAMPLLTLAAGGLPAGRLMAGSFVLLSALNLAYLPASGWHHDDFDDPSRSLRESAPARELVAQLNREHPGEPALFVGMNHIAGFHGQAYTDTWHTARFRDKLYATKTSRQVFDLFESLRLEDVVYPVRLETVIHPQLRYVLAIMVVPKSTNGSLRIGRLAKVSTVEPLRPGVYDDSDPRLDYEGAWITDPQFPRAFGGSVTYAKTSDSRLSLDFEGSDVVLTYTLAPNRGIAEVLVDSDVRSINAYSREVGWQTTMSLGPFPRGKHRLEIRILGKNTAPSDDTWFDIDRIEIR